MVKNLTVFSGNYNKINKLIVHSLINRLKKELNFDISSLIINFIPSKQILKINKEFLNHHFTTDIITFNYSGNHKVLDGEIFISIEDASSNAKKYSVSLNEEFMRLVIHGILHLLNYDDQDKNAKFVMKQMENKLVKMLKTEFLK